MKKTIFTLALALFAFSAITTSCGSGSGENTTKDTLKEKKDSQSTMSDLEKEVGGEETEKDSGDKD